MVMMMLFLWWCFSDIIFVFIAGVVGSPSFTMCCCLEYREIIASSCIDSQGSETEKDEDEDTCLCALNEPSVLLTNPGSLPSPQPAI